MSITYSSDEEEKLK